jgi:hypothetical protein
MKKNSTSLRTKQKALSCLNELEKRNKRHADEPKSAKIALNQKNKQAIFFLSATYIPAKRVKKKQV